jgi:small-conductance mechanosensitive channel
MIDTLKVKWLKTIFLSLLFFILSPTLHSEETDSLAVLNISEINYKIEKAKRIISKIDFVENDNKEIIRIDSILDEQKVFLDQQAKEFYSFKANSLSKVFLANTIRIWTEYSNHLKKLNKNNTHRFEKTDEDSRTLSKLNVDFVLLKKRIHGKQGFDIIIQRIDGLLIKIGKKKKEHYSFLRKTIEVEDKVEELTNLVDKTLNYTQNLLNQKKINTFKLTDPFIWDTQFEDGKYPNISSRIARAWYENKKLIVNQFSLVEEQIPYYIFYSFILVLIVFFTRNTYINLGFTEEDNGYVIINRILINNPIIVSIALVIALLLLMFPSAPILLTNLLGSILLLLTAFILSDSISNNDTKLIINYVIITLLYNLEILAWYFGGYSRLFFLIEDGVALFLLTSYYFSFLKNTKQNSEFTKYAKKYIPIIIYAYIISALAQIIGFVNLSILLNKILAIIPMITIVIYLAYKILNTFVISLSEILNIKAPLFNEIFPKHIKRLYGLIKIILVITWIKLIGNAFQLERTINQSINDILDYSLTEGQYSITVGSVLGFIVILLITYYISKLTSKIFSHDKVRKSKKTPRGFFSATSLSLRIVFVILGGSLALAKIGLDPSKFTIIAGALGVGIGFGLQDLVNNFISGLILIYGRPIQTGDTVEVDNLLGIVKEIGIRSSVLVTYDGAEILVPNSILISNKLTNWTLSDNRKRVEIFVGVEYGSDLEQVIEILELSASRVDTILKNPAPKALFIEFGDSSLNFRLRFWVSYEDGLSSKSEVSVIVYKMLADKGITIPFPQLDVHHFNDSENKDKT